jgi:hypothetical protein
MPIIKLDHYHDTVEPRLYQLSIKATPKIGVFLYLSRKSYSIREKDQRKCSNNESNDKENNIKDVFLFVS